jgi:hypothetical protein
VGQEIERVMIFLFGLKDRRIATTLAHHGFSQKDLDHGWTLVRGVVGERLDVGPIPHSDPDTLKSLDAWENKWFPIANATLTHNFPKVRDEVFLNLSQTRGAQVVISVGTLLRRIDELEKKGGDHAAARPLLGRRGLTQERLGAARGTAARAFPVARWGLAGAKCTFSCAFSLARRLMG